MKKLISILTLTLSLQSEAQVVSLFNFSTTPLTTASIGPNGTSISAQAITVAVPAPVNYAVNPGLPKTDIDLTIPGSPYFDLPGIDIDLYFKKEESEASFFKRGSVFDFGVVNGQLYVNFLTNAGSNPGTIAVASGAVYTLPSDHAFHRYRFIYDNNTGIARVYVDGVVVYTYTGTAGYTMNWTNAGNVVIGSKMDGTGTNVPILGMITVQNPAAAASLPLSFLSFTAAEKNGAALLDWTTTRELNVVRFTIESSTTGDYFDTVGSVTAKGSYAATHHYAFADTRHHGSTVYYRINAVDADNKSIRSEIRKIAFAPSLKASCYPNPATSFVVLSLTNATAGPYRYSVVTVTGNIIASAPLEISATSQQVRIPLTENLAKGILTIQLINVLDHSSTSFQIVKS